MTMKTPYDTYKKNPLWNIIEEGLTDLVDNQDIIIQTVPDYVIGYFVKKLVDNAFSINGIKKE